MFLDENKNYCTVKTSEAVNPLNLTSIEEIAEANMKKDGTVSSTNNVKRRRRRDTEYIIKPDTVVSSEDNKERQVVIMV